VDTSPGKGGGTSALPPTDRDVSIKILETVVSLM
jgi:hypothetical protein